MKHLNSSPSSKYNNYRKDKKKISLSNNRTKLDCKKCSTLKIIYISL